MSSLLLDKFDEKKIAHNEKAINQLRLVVALLSGIMVTIHDISGIWILLTYILSYLTIAKIYEITKCNKKP